MGIKLAQFKMIGHGPLLYGRPVHEDKEPDETHEQLNERIWQQRALVDGDNMLCISAVAVHRSLMSAGKWLSMKLEGNKTFTKRFTAGVMCHKPMFRVMKDGKPIHSGELSKKEYRIDLYVPSDGKQGGTKRVWRTYPRVLPTWTVDVELLITDDAISEDVLTAHAKCAGLHDGIGSMRIGTGGPNGLWELDSLQLSNYEL